MPISHKYKTIFTHIPKAGETSIEAVLDIHDGKKNIGLERYQNQTDNEAILYGKDLQHLTALVVKEKIGEITFNSFF